MRLLVALGLALAACSGPEPVRSTPAPRADAPAAPPAAPARVAPDPGPLLAHQPGTRAVRRADPITLPARAAVVDGHLYVVADLPAEPADVFGDTHLDGARFFTTGAEHGLAALGRDEDGGPPRRLSVRLVAEQLPGAVTLEGFHPERSHGGDGVFLRRAVTLSPLTRASDAKGLQRIFFRDLSVDLALLGGADLWRAPQPFHAFASARARLLGGLPEREAAAALGRQRTDLSEMMRLYTGMTSVAEALQTDRGLRRRAEPAARRTLPLASVEPVALAAHPWDRILDALGRPVSVEPLAEVVPDGVLYVHFHDLRRAVQALGDVDEGLTPLVQAAEGRAGSSHLAERYERQLMIERRGLAEKVGHLAASGVALVAGDPFFREGTDLGLVFQVNQPAMLFGALEAYERAARSGRDDVTQTTYALGGHTVRHVYTPDRRIEQHRLQLGNVLVLANSRPLIERFVAVAQGQATPLSRAGDFRAMRALYPYAPEAEDGFIFIGDAFVAHAVSPRTKILQARRMDAAADLAAVGYAALLYGWLEGHPPATAEALVTAGLATRAELAHADGAPITLDPATGPRSAAWGRPAALTPLSELAIDQVTPAEAEAYAEFRTTYQSYWRTFIDPIAVRLVRGPDGRSLTADARMLPLIAQSAYDDFLAMVGEARVRPPTLTASGPAGAGLEFDFALGDDARLRRDLDRLGRGLGEDVGLGWLGHWLAVGASDRWALWDLALLLGAVPELRPGRTAFSDMPDHWRVLSRLPIYVAAEVARPEALAAALGGLRRELERGSPGSFDWSEVGQHRGVSIVGVRQAEGEGTLPEGAEDLSLYYATPGDVLVATFDRGTLLQQIDRVLDGHAARRAEPDAEAPQAALQVAPRADGPLARVLSGLTEATQRHGLTVALRDVEALGRGLGQLPRDPEARREAALGYLGYEPALAQGGAFALDPLGFATHSLYGSEIAPVFPEIPQPGAPLTRLFEALDRLSGAFAFEGEGDTRGLRVWFEWRRR